MQQVPNVNHVASIVLLVISVIFGLIFGFACATIAGHKGHNSTGFFFLGFFLGLIGLVITAVVVGVQKPGEFAFGIGPKLPVRYLNKGTDIDKGSLQFQVDRLTFIQRNRRYRLDIPYYGVQSVRVLDRTDLPAGNPSITEMMLGRKFLLEVTYGINGYRYLGVFAGNPRLSSLVNRKLMPLLGGAVAQTQVAQQPIHAVSVPPGECPSCGKATLPDHRFCAACGAELTPSMT